MEDKEVIDLGVGRPLEFIHTRGHAKHHFVVHDTMSKRYEPNYVETVSFCQTCFSLILGISCTTSLGVFFSNALLL